MKKKKKKEKKNRTDLVDRWRRPIGSLDGKVIRIHHGFRVTFQGRRIYYVPECSTGDGQ